MLRFLLVLSLLLGGCARRASEGVYDSDEYAESAPMAKRAYAGAPPPPPAPPMADRAAAPATTATSATTPTTGGPAVAPSPARMVHYQGFAQLRVAKEDEGLDAVIALAKAAGGEVEQQYGSTVVVRVPVATFQETFAAILKVGDVVTKSIAADDVTEAFLSVELRLATAKARRDRLVALLAQAKDENEKLALVREIQEVTEEIDKLEEGVRTLRRLADFSRITVQLEARPALTWQGGAPESAAFAWIRQLTPFSEGPSDKRLALEVPEGFVSLDVRRRFVAESADGARIWTTRLPNDPVGTTAFWTDALTTRLSGEFAAAEPVTVGAWRGLRLVDRSAEPYAWVVLVRAEGRALDVVQVFYPSKAAEARHAPAVQAVLAGGGAS